MEQSSYTVEPSKHFGSGGLSPSHTACPLGARPRLEDESLYELSVPSSSAYPSHGVSLLAPGSVDALADALQVLTTGTVAVHLEEDTGRAACVCLQIERSHGLIVWCKASPAAVKAAFGAAETTLTQLGPDMQEKLQAAVVSRFESKESVFPGLEEGFIELLTTKDVRSSGTAMDLSPVARRYNLRTSDLECRTTVRIHFGATLTDNRCVEFLLPRGGSTRAWTDGLRNLLKAIKSQRQLADQRTLWLKHKYLQLYYRESACCGPTPADAIKVFGGRKWTLNTSDGTVGSQSGDTSSPATKHRTSTFGIAKAKLLKKKSAASLHALRDAASPRSARRSVTSGEFPSDLSAALTAAASTKPLRKQSTLSSSIFGSFRIGKRESDVGIKSATASSTGIESEPSSGLYAPPCTPQAATSCENISISTASGAIKSQPVSPGRKPSSANCQTALTMDTTTPDPVSGEVISASAIRVKQSITHSSQMNFIEFCELFRSFMIRSRADIKELFEQLASRMDTSGSQSGNASKSDSFEDAPSGMHRRLGLLSRNSGQPLSEAGQHRVRIWDAIASASIVANCAGVDTRGPLAMTCEQFQAFLRTYQGEDATMEETQRLIERHETDATIRERHCLGFEGFAGYLLDKDNYAFTPELLTADEGEMDSSISHYYVATSHNTYLTGHQLKGESSVDMYANVLLAGCRCVELDCWDGDDGFPIIYHGHTLTSKISFRKVIEAINDAAFVNSSYPVILSIENHCSLPQQSKMAQIFATTLGDKLVTKFMFDTDFLDDPRLPSPNQLRCRILIKNKKLRAPLIQAIQVKVKNASGQGSGGRQPHRTNSLLSVTSSGSLNEDDDDFDDEEEDDDDDLVLPHSGSASSIKTHGVKAVALRTESSSSQEGITITTTTTHSEQSITQTKSQLPTVIASTSDTKVLEHAKVVRKSSSQVAPELSDLVNYFQAVKFRGLLPVDPQPSSSSAMKKISSRKSMLSPMLSQAAAASSSLATTPVGSTTDLQVPNSMSNSGSTPNIAGPVPPFLGQPGSVPTSTTSSTSGQRRTNPAAACYQVASLNENVAKKLCRKTPLAVMTYTDTQVMRSYPAGMRIDSSNFNPLTFWAFGVQMAALNYQTEDIALAINTAMFEQNGLCGYVKKPPVMTDKQHVMYGRFNPWEKEFDGLYAVDLTVTVIAGQYVVSDSNTGSPQVEVEIIGIPVDCSKQRTKMVQRNSLNPIWNDSFLFRVTFADLAFIRFAVIDTASGHVASQRVVPITALKQGYRHLRLRSATNQPLPLASLFVFTSSQEEGMEVAVQSYHSVDIEPSGGIAAELAAMRRRTAPTVDLTRLESRDTIGSAPVRRRMFFLVVHGVIVDEPSTILKITQDSSTDDVIHQALSKANKPSEKAYDYVLIEEVARGWDRKQLLKRNSYTQRILDSNERPLEAQAQWKGDGRFVLKKVADDPSSRAWMSTIKAASIRKERMALGALRQDSDGGNTGDSEFTSWNDDPMDNFLVCVYNVSPDQPYAILKASVSSTATDIIQRALLKARRMEDAKRYVILEEVEFNPTADQSSASSKHGHRHSCIVETKRVLADDEVLYHAQSAWKGKGLFRLVLKEDAPAPATERELKPKGLARLTRTAKGSLRKLNRIGRMSSTKSKESSTERESSPAQSDSLESEPGCQPVGGSGLISVPSPAKRAMAKHKKEERSTASVDETVRYGVDRGTSPTKITRDVHSEGESETQLVAGNQDNLDPDAKLAISSMSRLKRLSIKRWKVWR